MLNRVDAKSDVTLWLWTYCGESDSISVVFLLLQLLTRVLSNEESSNSESW